MKGKREEHKHMSSVFNGGKNLSGFLRDSLSV